MPEPSDAPIRNGTGTSQADPLVLRGRSLQHDTGQSRSREWLDDESIDRAGLDEVQDHQHRPSHGPAQQFSMYQEVARLAGGLAHEIRNPLSTMRLNLELLGELMTQVFTDHPDPIQSQRAETLLNRVRRETDRLKSTLDEFLQFARLQRVVTVPADLNSVVSEVVDFFLPQADRHHVVLRTQFAEELADRETALNVDQFKQALLNLMLNAQQAMDHGGELIITTRRDQAEGWHVVEVTDSGRGMPPEIQDRIFEAFYSTKPGGSGLGLSTTRKILQAHGGTIELESEVGKGTRFTIRLPAADRSDFEGSGDRPTTSPA